MAVRIPIGETGQKRPRRHLTQDQKYTYSMRAFFVFLILVAGLLQNTPHCFPTIMGVHAYLLLPLAVCIAMFEKGLYGVILSVFAGTLWDVSTAALDGFHAVFFLLAAGLIFALMNYLMRNNLVTALLLSAGVILLYTMVHWLVFNVLRGTGDVFWRLARYDLPAAGYSFLFTPVFYPIIRSVLKKLRAKYPRHPAPTVL
ncbi:MAG: rod shape-determining protein MreD [Clostridia bacterium]|nr:rod shape-determining protein MreD [Clostridia bacterium]